MICLNHFRDLYQQYKDLPEDIDEMLVADYFTQAITTDDGQMIKTFRFFFTTRRLISFSTYIILILYSFYYFNFFTIYIN